RGRAAAHRRQSQRRPERRRRETESCAAWSTFRLLMIMQHAKCSVLPHNKKALASDGILIYSAAMRPSRLLVLLAATALFFATPAAALQSYFINNEVKSDNIELFPKWTGMLDRYDEESHTLGSVCGEDRFN